MHAADAEAQAPAQTAHLAGKKHQRLALQIYQGWVQHQHCRAHCTAHSNCTGQIAAAGVGENLLQYRL
jgi:hypothetical protein